MSEAAIWAKLQADELAKVRSLDYDGLLALTKKFDKQTNWAMLLNQAQDHDLAALLLVQLLSLLVEEHPILKDEINLILEQSRKHGATTKDTTQGV